MLWRVGPAGGEKGAAGGIDDGRIKAFLDHVWKKEKLSDGEGHALMMIAMAASYDTDLKAPLGFRIPLNMETGELIDVRWKAWLKHDPVRLVARHRDALKSLKGIFIDCGWRDQFHIHYGCRQLSRELARHGIVHTYEEFDGTHSGIDYRLERSLPFLTRALAPG